MVSFKKASVKQSKKAVAFGWVEPALNFELLTICHAPSLDKKLICIFWNN
jgi:hypothetical protein